MASTTSGGVGTKGTSGVRSCAGAYAALKKRHKTAQLMILESRITAV
jgi:hypothetical protein